MEKRLGSPPSANLAALAPGISVVSSSTGPRRCLRRVTMPVVLPAPVATASRAARFRSSEELGVFVFQSVSGSVVAHDQGRSLRFSETPRLALLSLPRGCAVRVHAPITGYACFAAYRSGVPVTRASALI